jgi:ribosomal-protein-alanine N-acetyltransferase
MTKLSFASMRLSDLDEVMMIEKKSYPISWSKSVMRDCIKSDYHCIVLKMNTKVIGFGIVMTILDEAHLLNMCVDSDFQGKGYGRKLLKYIENICIYNHCKVFLLEVRESSPVARSLYKSFGFKQIGLRKNYYKKINGREHAIVMNKTL